MDYLLVCTVSLVVAGLTLFSGFGLGTLLMPAFAVFFELEVAIAATAVVHLANNVFKVWLLGRGAPRRVVVLFGVPAIGGALAGAALLLALSGIPPLFSYEAGRVRGTVEPIKLVIAALLAVFALLEVSPRFQRLSFPAALLPVGGVVSGFFGGLSGMQGALRAAFLVRAGLSRDQFIATAVVVSTMVDCTRLLIYAIGLTALAGVIPGLTRLGGKADLARVGEARTLGLIVAASLAAFAGSVLGARLVKKVTLRTVQKVVAVMLLVFAGALAAGVI
ncbi:MAG: TSUP family transporter [Phycisphaerales bacterium]